MTTSNHPTPDRPIPDHLGTVNITVDWDVTSTDAALDLDLTAYVLGDGGSVLADDYFVFFNNLETPNKEIQLGGGRDGNHAETLYIDTPRLPAQAAQVMIAVTVYDQLAGFGRVNRATITVNDSVCGAVARYELSTARPDVTALVYASLIRENGKWRFLARGDKHNSLLSITAAYGVTT